MSSEIAQAAEQDREEVARRRFLAERAPKINASDFPKLLGLSGYGDPFSLWLRITEARAGRTPPDGEDSDRLEMGRLLEPIIAARASKRLGLTFREAPVLVHPRFDWLAGHVDREAVETEADLECKSVEWDPLKKWSDPEKGEVTRIPEEYVVQVAIYIGLRDALGQTRPHHVAAQFGFGKLRTYRLEPDRKMIAIFNAMVERAHAFWERHVLTGDPPPVGSSPATEAWLKQRFPTHGDDKPVRQDNSDEVAEVFRAYADAKKKYDAADEQKSSLENEIKRLVGDAYGIEGKNGGLQYRATWPYIKPQEGLVTDHNAVLLEFAEMVGRPVPAELIQKHSRFVVTKQGYRRLSPATVKEV